MRERERENEKMRNCEREREKEKMRKCEREREREKEKTRKRERSRESFYRYWIQGSQMMVPLAMKSHWTQLPLPLKLHPTFRSMMMMKLRNHKSYPPCQLNNKL